MQTRRYNSQALKEVFSDFYREFFSTCATVVSAPGMFLWAGNLGLLAGSIGLAQNLPLRVYAGLSEQASNDMVVFDKCFSFNCPARKFNSYEMDESIKNELSIFLKQEIEEILGNRKFKGLKIDLISEIPIGHSLNASGALSAALSCAIFLHYQKITPRQLETCLTKKTTELLNDRLFNQLFRLAWKIEAIFHGGLTSGVGAFTPFIATHSPIVYFVEPPSQKDLQTIHYSCDIGEGLNKNYRLIDQLSYGAFKLSELSSNSDDFFFSFSFGLINSGASGSSTVANRALKSFENSLLETCDFSQKKLEKYFQKFFKCLPAFAKLFFKKEITKIGEASFLLTSVLSLNIIFSLYNLNQKHLSVSDFMRLIENLNNCQNIYIISQTLSLFTANFYNLIKERARKLEDEYGVGFKLTNNTHGGYLLFVTAFQRAKNGLFKIVEEIKKEFGNEVSIDWTSW